MKKTTTWIIVSVAIIVILIGALIAYDLSDFYALKDTFDNSKTFSSFDDFAFMSEYVTDTKNDKEKLNGVTPDNQVRYEVLYEKTYYTVLAYEFTNKADCYDYAKELTGKDYASLEEQYKYSEFTLFNSVDLVIYLRVDGYVITETKILRVAANASKKKYNAFMQFLFKHLPTAVDPL